MATPAPPTIQTEISLAYKFLVDPGHLILLVLLLIAGFFSIYEYDSKRALAADQRAALAQQQAQIQDKTNASYQETVRATLQQLSTRNDNLASQLASLNASISLRTSSLTKTQMAVPQMQPSQLANDWENFINVPDSISSTQGGFLVNDKAAVATVQQLESIPVLKQNLSDETTEIQESQAQLGNETQALVLEKQAHASDTAACVTDKQTLTAQLNKAKSDSKKSKLKWFFGGFVSGLITGLLK